MIYSRERHKQLVTKAQNLKTQGKNLFRENPEEDFELNRYDMALEEQIFWVHRKNFALIMKKFLDNILDFEEFETAFRLLYYDVREKCNLFKRDLNQIETFHPSKRSDRFASYMNGIFREFEAVEDEHCLKQDLKNYVKEIYLKIQKFEE